jgi:hypothetical protein
MKLLITILLVFYMSPLAAIVGPYLYNPNECVVFQGYTIDHGQFALRFFNNCENRVYVQVCMRDSWGNYEMKKSFQRIPVNGTFNLYSFPGEYPESFVFSSDADDPEFPPQCKELSLHPYNGLKSAIASRIIIDKNRI